MKKRIMFISTLTSITLILIISVLSFAEEITLRTIVPDNVYKRKVSFELDEDINGDHVLYHAASTTANVYKIPQDSTSDVIRLFDPWLKVEIDVKNGDIVHVLFSGTAKGCSYGGIAVANDCENFTRYVCPNNWLSDNGNNAKATCLGSTEFKIGDDNYQEWMTYNIEGYFTALIDGTLEFRLTYYNKDYTWPTNIVWKKTTTDWTTAAANRADGTWAEAVGHADLRSPYVMFGGTPTEAYHNGPGLWILLGAGGTNEETIENPLQRDFDTYIGLAGRKPIYKRAFNQDQGYFNQDSENVLMYDPDYGKNSCPQIVFGANRIASAEIINRVNEAYSQRAD